MFAARNRTLLSLVHPGHQAKLARRINQLQFPHKMPLRANMMMILMILIHEGRRVLVSIQCLSFLPYCYAALPEPLFSNEEDRTESFMLPYSHITLSQVL